MALSPDVRHVAPSLEDGDGDGVRVLRKPGPRFGIEARVSAAIVLLVGIAVGGTLLRPGDEAPTAVADTPDPPVHATATRDDIGGQGTALAVARPLDPSTPIPAILPSPASGDPDDLASYFQPGDPVPSTANLIRALNEAGVRSGIAAFNPPGTSPPLEGLAVPADFELPPGYVRHHQATDDGESIEPILMFSPDLVLRDAQGRPIPLPANLVVPPELAPPGLPLRWVRPGKP